MPNGAAVATYRERRRAALLWYPREDQQLRSRTGDSPQSHPLDAGSDESSDAIVHLPRPSPAPHSRQVDCMIRSENCRKQALQIKVASIVAFAHHAITRALAFNAKRLRCCDAA